MLFPKLSMLSPSLLQGMLGSATSRMSGPIPSWLWLGNAISVLLLLPWRLHCILNDPTSTCIRIPAVRALSWPPCVSLELSDLPPEFGVKQGGWRAPWLILALERLPAQGSPAYMYEVPSLWRHERKSYHYVIMHVCILNYIHIYIYLYVYICIYI